MKKFSLFIAFMFIGFLAMAQGYETPDTGVNWTLEELAANSPESISFADGAYTLSQDITVSASDTLTLIPSDTLKIDADIRVTVEGAFLSIGTANDSITITATDTSAPYDGFRFNEGSSVAIDYNTIEYGGGLKTITTDFSITNSTLQYNVAGVSTGATISFSHGSPLVQNNTFLSNDMPAVSSPANGDVSALIIDNLIKYNTQSNQNRPQINMGPTGTTDTLKIIGNTIIGDRAMTNAGGIAVANMIGGQIHALIQDNLIKDNRYGITVVGGNAHVAIIGNTIEDNDSQDVPMQGGSGLSVNSASDTQEIILTDNAFRGNLWGITVIGEASVNLGDDENNPGNNVFSDNGNNGVTYALYNNTPNTILAKHNCWIEGQDITPEEAAAVIFDVADNPDLGEVIYTPLNTDCSLSVPEQTKTAVTIYPNPAKNELHFTAPMDFSSVSIFSLTGKLVSQSQLAAGQQTISLNLESGIYIIRFENGNGQINKKLIVQ